METLKTDNGDEYLSPDHDGDLCITVPCHDANPHDVFLSKSDLEKMLSLYKD